MMNIKLTEKEVEILNGMRTNNFGDCFEWPQWTFSIIDETDFTEKTARGVISSLVKKNLVSVSGTYGSETEESQIGFTELGRKLIEQNAGDKTCNWGGINLLNEGTQIATILEENDEPQIGTSQSVEFTGEETIIENLEEIQENLIQQIVETHTRAGNTKEIEVFKDGELIKTLDSLTETFKWATENNIANSGWIKHSLKTGKTTTSGRKYKDGGYKFQYKI